MSSTRRVSTNSHARKSPTEPESAPPITDSALRRELEEAVAWLDGAREAVEELLFTADDATSLRPGFPRKSLRRCAFEDGIEAQRALRCAQRAIEAVSGKLMQRGGRS